MVDKKLSFNEFVKKVETDIFLYIDDDLKEFYVQTELKMDDYGLKENILSFQSKENPVKKCPGISLDAAYANYKRIDNIEKIMFIIARDCMLAYKDMLKKENTNREIPKAEKGSEVEMSFIPGNEEIGVNSLIIIKRSANTSWDKYESKVREKLSPDNSSTDDILILPISEVCSFAFTADSIETVKDIEEANELLFNSCFKFQLDEMRLYSKADKDITIGFDNIKEKITEKERRRKSVFNIGK